MSILEKMGNFFGDEETSKETKERLDKAVENTTVKDMETTENIVLEGTPEQIRDIEHIDQARTEKKKKE